MAHYTPPELVGPSKVVLWEPSLGRLELGDLPFVVESFQIGSPDIRDNVKNRALADGVFDDTMYHGASAITLTVRLAPHMKCNPRIANYWMATLRDTLVSYMSPRLRPRLYWRYPGDEQRVQPLVDVIAGFGSNPFDYGPFGGSLTMKGPAPEEDMNGMDGLGQWAEVRGASWPFTVNGPKYPTLAVQFKNSLGQMFLGDPEAAPHTVTSYPGSEAGGRSYDLSFDRDYPNVDNPGGTALIHNNGNSYADWTLQVHGPFDAGATVVFVNPDGTVVSIDLNQAVPVNQYVTFNSRRKTILLDSGLTYYPHTNFGEWAWEQVRLSHGDTRMTFDGVALGAPSGWATIEWYSTSI